MLDCGMHRHASAGCLWPRHRKNWLQTQAWIRAILLGGSLDPFAARHSCNESYLFGAACASRAQLPVVARLPFPSTDVPSSIMSITCLALVVANAPVTLLSTIPVPRTGLFDVSSIRSNRFDLRFVPIDGPLKPVSLRVRKEMLVEARGRIQCAGASDTTCLQRATKWTAMENGGAFSSLEELQTVSHDLMQQIREKMREGLNPKAFYDDVMHFVHSVRWSEPWLVGLIVMEIVLATVVLITRKNLSAQTFLFFLLFVMVYWAENLNTLLDRHWKKFATQAYFDRTGLFLSVVYSGPMLLIMVFIIINNLIQMVKMMVKVKRMELKFKAIQENKKKGKKKE